MKLFRKILLVTGIVLLVVVVGAIIYVSHIKHKGLPDLNEDVQIEGLQAEVTIVRDSMGVPTIYASNEHDLYLATGYVMAQDRLWQMDLLRRVTTGRLSEIFGERMQKSDKLLRFLHMSEKSAQQLDSLPENMKESIVAFSDGVNAYINANADKLPIEFTVLGYKPEPWTPIHTANLTGYMAWDLSMGWSTEVLLDRIKSKVGDQKFIELFPQVSNTNSYIYPNFSIDSLYKTISDELTKPNLEIAKLGVDILHGSNNWVVAGKKSADGSPMLANDMHLGLAIPGVWYQIHQVIEGKLDVTGVALPGQPMVVCGHNAYYAWGMTNVMLDDMDFYVETINPENPNQYKFNGTWRDLKVVFDTILTKDGARIPIETKFTHRGPIISDYKKVEDRAISMRWLGNSYSNEVRTVYELNHGKNWNEFRSALQYFGAVAQNVVYADKDGNIGLQNTGMLAIREGKRYLLAPGDTDLYDWKGFVPFDSLPFEFNPEKGYLASANNRTVSPNYPYYISAWFDQPYRYDRIVEMLEEKEKLSVDDFKKMHGDFKSKQTELMYATIVKILNAKTDWNDDEAEALKVYAAWDGVHNAGAAATTIYEVHYMEFARALFEDELGTELYNDYMSMDLLAGYVIRDVFMGNSKIQWMDNVNTPDVKETFEQLVTESFSRTVKSIGERMGENPEMWQWGKIHQLLLKHPLGEVAILNKIVGLNRGPYAVGGSFHTVSPYSYDVGENFISDNGASHRHIYTTSDWDKSQTVIPTGNSGQPGSEFYCNQTEMYLNNIYHSDGVSKNAVEKKAMYTMKLTPVSK